MTIPFLIGGATDQEVARYVERGLRLECWILVGLFLFLMALFAYVPWMYGHRMEDEVRIVTGLEHAVGAQHLDSDLKEALVLQLEIARESVKILEGGIAAVAFAMVFSVTTEVRTFFLSRRLLRMAQSSAATPPAPAPPA